MQVKLINYTPHPEDTVAAAARLCYSKEDIANMLKEFQLSFFILFFKNF